MRALGVTLTEHGTDFQESHEFAIHPTDGMACHVADSEGAGAASFAAAMQERERPKGQTVGIPLCRGNADSAVFAGVLRG